MKPGVQMRNDALRRYVILRMKLIEMIHLQLIWIDLYEGHTPDNILKHTNSQFADSIRTAMVGWFVTLVDESAGGMHAFRIWEMVFPKHKKRIQATWKRIRPGWQYLRRFRDKCAFHADTPVNFIRAKQQLRTEHKRVERAVNSFLKLAVFLLKAEGKEVPEFYDTVESMLLDVELQVPCNINRKWFRDLGLLPSERFKQTF